MKGSRVLLKFCPSLPPSFPPFLPPSFLPSTPSLPPPSLPPTFPPLSIFGFFSLEIYAVGNVLLLWGFYALTMMALCLSCLDISFFNIAIFFFFKKKGKIKILQPHSARKEYSFGNCGMGISTKERSLAPKLGREIKSSSPELLTHLCLGE